MLACIEEKHNLTTETTQKILILDKQYHCRKIGVDDGGLGFGVFSELLGFDQTKRKTMALNNASRPIDNEGERGKKLLKEEMYSNLLMLMEQGRLKLIDDEDIKLSLASIQIEDNEISGGYDHIAEAINRAAWLAEKEKGLNIFCHSF
jgi:hypothetical protein